MLKIFVKGNEKRFIEDLIEVRLGKIKGVDFEVLRSGGWTKLDEIKPKIQEFNDLGHHVQIIFDADTPPEGGNENRRQLIEQFRTENNLNFELFLFPENTSDGDFELLLEGGINDNHRRILDCFDDYEHCIGQFNSDQKVYNLPIRKSKIYAYVDTFPKSNKQSEKFKQGYFFYKNPEIWDLSSEQINPLLDFIQKGITPPRRLDGHMQ